MKFFLFLCHQSLFLNVGSPKMVFIKFPKWEVLSLYKSENSVDYITICLSSTGNNLKEKSNIQSQIQPKRKQKDVDIYLSILIFISQNLVITIFSILFSSGLYFQSQLEINVARVLRMSSELFYLANIQFSRQLKRKKEKKKLQNYLFFVFYHFSQKSKLDIKYFVLFQSEQSCINSEFFDMDIIIKQILSMKQNEMNQFCSKFNSFFEKRMSTNDVVDFPKPASLGTLEQIVFEESQNEFRMSSMKEAPIQTIYQYKMQSAPTSHPGENKGILTINPIHVQFQQVRLASFSDQRQAKSLGEQIDAVKQGAKKFKEWLDFQNSVEYKQLLNYKVDPQAEVIVVLGPTQAGKSTLISFLTCTGVDLPTQSDKPEMRATFKGVKIAIGNGVKSQTRIPQLYSDSSNPKIFYLDTPGFRDTQKDMILVNTKAIYICLSKFDKFKCIFVCRMNQFEDYNTINQLKNILLNMFPSITSEDQKDSSNISYVATHTGAERDISFFSKSPKEQYDALRKTMVKKIAIAKKKYQNPTLEKFVQKFQKRAFSSPAFKAVQSEEKENTYQLYMLRNEKLNEYISYLRKDIHETQTVKYNLTKMFLEEAAISDLNDKFAVFTNFINNLNIYQEDIHSVLLRVLQDDQKSLENFSTLIELIVTDRSASSKNLKQLKEKEASFKASLRNDSLDDKIIIDLYQNLCLVIESLNGIRGIASFLEVGLLLDNSISLKENLKVVKKSHTQIWGAFAVKLFEKSIQQKRNLYYKYIASNSTEMSIKQLQNQLKIVYGSLTQRKKDQNESLFVSSSFRATKQIKKILQSFNEDITLKKGSMYDFFSDNKALFDAIIYKLSQKFKQLEERFNSYCEGYLIQTVTSLKANNQNIISFLLEENLLLTKQEHQIQQNREENVHNADISSPNDEILKLKREQIIFEKSLKQYQKISQGLAFSTQIKQFRQKLNNPFKQNGNTFSLFEKLFTKEAILKDFNKIFLSYLQNNYKGEGIKQMYLMGGLQQKARTKRILLQIRANFDQAILNQDVLTYFVPFMKKLFEETTDIKDTDKAFMKNVVIYGDYKAQGKDLYIVAENLLVMKKNLLIDLSGNQFSENNSILKDYRISPKNGKPGQSSGCLYLFVENYINPENKLSIKLSGGPGQIGQHAASPPQRSKPFPQFNIIGRAPDVQEWKWWTAALSIFGGPIAIAATFGALGFKQSRASSSSYLVKFNDGQNYTKLDNFYSTFRQSFYNKSFGMLKELSDNQIYYQKMKTFNDFHDKSGQQIFKPSQQNGQLFTYTTKQSHYKQKLLPTPNFISEQNYVKTNKTDYIIRQDKFSFVFYRGMSGENAFRGGLGGYNGYNGECLTNVSQYLIRQTNNQIGQTKIILNQTQNGKVVNSGLDGKPEEVILNKGIVFAAFTNRQDKDSILGYQQQFNNELIDEPNYEKGKLIPPSPKREVPKPLSLSHFQVIQQEIKNQLLRGNSNGIALKIRLSKDFYENHFRMCERLEINNKYSSYFDTLLIHCTQLLELMEKINLSTHVFSTEDFLNLIKNFQTNAQAVYQLSKKQPKEFESFKTLTRTLKICADIKKKVFSDIPIETSLEEYMKQIQNLNIDIKKQYIENYKKDIADSRVNEKSLKITYAIQNNFTNLGKEMQQNQGTLFETLDSEINFMLNLAEIEIKKQISINQKAIQTIEKLQKIGIIFGALQVITKIAGVTIDPTGGLISQAASQSLGILQSVIEKGSREQLKIAQFKSTSINLPKLKSSFDGMMKKQKEHKDLIKLKLDVQKMEGEQKQNNLKKIKDAQKKQKEDSGFVSTVKRSAEASKDEIQKTYTEFFKLQKQKSKYKKQIQDLRKADQAVHEKQKAVNNNISLLLESSHIVMNSIYEVFLDKNPQNNQYKVDFLKLIYAIKSAQMFFTQIAKTIEKMTAEVVAMTTALNIHVSQNLKNQLEIYSRKLNFYIANLVQMARYIEELMQNRDLMNFIKDIILPIPEKQMKPQQNALLHVIRRSRITYNMNIIKENVRIRDFLEYQEPIEMEKFGRHNQLKQDGKYRTVDFFDKVEAEFYREYFSFVRNIFGSEKTKKLQKSRQKTKMYPLYHWTGQNFESDLVRLFRTAISRQKQTSFEEHPDLYVKFQANPLYWDDFSVICLNGRPNFTLYHPNPHLLIKKNNQIYLSKNDPIPKVLLKRILLLDSMKYQVRNDTYVFNGLKSIQYLTNNNLSQTVPIKALDEFTRAYTSPSPKPIDKVQINRANYLSGETEVFGNQNILISTEKISPYGKWYLRLHFDDLNLSLNYDEAKNCILRLEAPWSAVQNGALTKEVQAERLKMIPKFYGSQFVGKKDDYNVAFKQL